MLREKIKTWEVKEIKKGVTKRMTTTVEQIRAEGGKKWLKGINESLKDKGLGQMLNSWIPYVHGGLKCEMALLTVQYDPNIVKTEEEAWKDVLKMEKTVVDILGMEEDILYVVSGVEMHPGRKKGKEVGKKQEIKEETISARTSEEVQGVFKKYNEKMEEKGTEDMKEVMGRIKKYLYEMGNGLGEKEGEKVVKEAITMALNVGEGNVPEWIYPIIIGSLNGIKVKKIEGGEVTLKGYPHIHMGVAFTTTTGITRDLNEIKRKIQPYVRDVDFTKRDGTSTGIKRGRKMDISNDAKIMGYVLKNARHETTMEKIERTPVVVYNYRNEPNIENVYTMLYQQTAVAMSMDTRERERMEIKVPFILEIMNAEPENAQTNLAPKVTNKPITRSKKSRMMNIVKTYLEANQMALTARGTIYQRIKESKKSWKYWGMPEELYEEMCDPENFELLDSTRKQFFTYTTGKFKKLLPYVELDYQWIEFKDFMYNLTTSEVIKENIERQPYESFAYIPETEYEDIHPELKKKPKRWFEILRNSGYMEGEELTEKGKELIMAVNDIYKPKTHKSKSLVLHGKSNSGKTSLIDPIYDLYPKDARMKITAAGGFELAGLIMRPQFVVSDEHDKGRLRRDQTLILVEGDVEMALNIKHVNTQTVNVEARSAFICNEIDWAMKEGSEKKSVLTMIDAETGREIKVEQEIDEAYENRMLFCEMNVLPRGKCSSVVRRKMIEEEKGLIPLYVGKMIHGEEAFKIRK